MVPYTLHCYKCDNLEAKKKKRICNRFHPKVPIAKRYLTTRQLPIGAGHCPWGGHTY